MIRRWLMALLETEIRALVRDEVDFCLIDIGLNDQAFRAIVDQQINVSLDRLADSAQKHHR